MAPESRRLVSGLPNSASGLYRSGSEPSTPAKRSAATSSRKRQRSIWKSADTKAEWEELIAASTLSIAAPSTRRPRPRGLPTLVRCASEAAARGFKRLWEEGVPSLAVSEKEERSYSLKEELRGAGCMWTLLWESVPDHLKEGVRDGVFRWWGSYLSPQVLRQFLIPPCILLPGHLLPCISAATHIKPLHPSTDIAGQFTSLILTHAPKASDVSIAGLIHHLPNLEVINLKGCTLAGKKVVETILKRCPRLRRLNIKGTAVGGEELRELLEALGQQLEGLKLDGVRFQNSPDKAFASRPFGKITHLCLPGEIINSPSHDFRDRAKRFGHTLAHPVPRPAPADALLDWPRLGEIFPFITHLYLPGLLLPPDTTISIPPNQLIKLALGPGGPPVPIIPLANLINAQFASLRSVHIGHLLPAAEYELGHLGDALLKCEILEDFRFQADPAGSRDARCDHALRSWSHLVYVDALQGPWQKSLKRLTLQLPQRIDALSFIPVESPDYSVVLPLLEQLDMPSAQISDTATFANAIARYRNLRSLDLSSTSVADEDVYTILDGCPLISRIDLTSCRGVSVKNRRNIFNAWEEARKQPGQEVKPAKRHRR